MRVVKILAVAILALWFALFARCRHQLWPFEADLYSLKALLGLLLSLVGVAYFQMLAAVSWRESGTWKRLLLVSHKSPRKRNAIQLLLLLVPLWPVGLALSLMVSLFGYPKGSDQAQGAPEVTPRHAWLLGLWVLVGLGLWWAPARPEALPKSLQFRRTPKNGQNTVRLLVLIEDSGRYRYLVSRNEATLSRGEVEAEGVRRLSLRLGQIGLTRSFDPSHLAPGDDVFQVAVTSSDNKIVWGTWGSSDPRCQRALDALSEVPALRQGLEQAHNLP